MQIPINEVIGWLAASNAHAGCSDEARQTLNEFLRVAKDDMVEYPGTTMADWETNWHGAIEYMNDCCLARELQLHRFEIVHAGVAGL